MSLENLSRKKLEEKELEIVAGGCFPSIKNILFFAGGVVVTLMLCGSCCKVKKGIETYFGGLLPQDNDNGLH